jgi:hypothetical protein
MRSVTAAPCLPGPTCRSSAAMRPAVTALVSLLVLVAASASAHADEPPTPRFRVEVGAGPAISLDGTRAPAHLGFGVQLRPHIELAAEVGHIFGLPSPEPDDGKLITRFDHLGFGVRIWGDVGPVVLSVTEMVLGARYESESGKTPPHEGDAYGSVSRFALDLPVGGGVSVGIAGQALLAIDVLEAAELHLGVELHVAARF